MARKKTPAVKATYDLVMSAPHRGRAEPAGVAAADLLPRD